MLRAMRNLYANTSGCMPIVCERGLVGSCRAGMHQAFKASDGRSGVSSGILPYPTAHATMLKIHHLGHSQSERIVWLCEELGLPYDLVHYTRDAVTRLSPPALRALHPLGAAPVLEADGLQLAESAAIVEYIIVVHGGGRLKLEPPHPDYAAYLYWFHFANGNLQPVIGRLMSVSRAKLGADHPLQKATQERFDRVLALVEARLGEAPFLAGEKLTAADIMTVFSLTTMRLFQPFDLAAHPNIRAYLQRIGSRAAYRRAMEKGDPDLVPMLQ
jgi:glutathione S-transferase